ncbi:Maf family nucleotide pyrophosphatase [Methanolobus profundi]|uniref:dTTP/UTP pyrophosphatase n=1 Tax=Methanolobus profundi TaxID=487685 RepID=A0A1I4PM57_9EURY|nr:Maf family nucleotide pyrophosphatase [Methanolobus profundi]SFM28726.1 septum formation protein [Methanolobus profundi]
MRPIILASASERRKELLAQLIGKKFEVRISSYDEDVVDGLGPVELVMYHSREKALDITNDLTEGIIISADTVVVCDGEVLGKPENEEHAKSMLSQINGRAISAVTGLTVMDAASKKVITEHEMTSIWMRMMSEELINDYINTGEPFGKAGSFAIQGKGAILVERIDGDFFNVVGLPLFRLSKMLEKFNINVLGH